MQIKDYNNVSSVLGLSQIQTAVHNNVPQEAQVDELRVSTDSYTPSSAFPLASGMYGASGREIEAIPPAPPSTEAFEVNARTDGESSLMSRLSSAFRANEDSILTTMANLGLTEADLSDEDNMTLLANAMNDGAKSLGVPQIEDVEATVKGLMNGGSGSGGASAGGAGGGGGSSDEEETTTQVVRINGVTYLETTRTENGVSTTTRQVIGTEEA